jgi:hypothetical protein
LIHKCSFQLIEIVGIETEKVSKEKAIADEEELKVSFILTLIDSNTPLKSIIVRVDFKSKKTQSKPTECFRDLGMLNFPMVVRL